MLILLFCFPRLLVLYVFKALVDHLSELDPTDFQRSAPVAHFHEVEDAVAHLARRHEVVVSIQTPTHFPLRQPFGFTYLAQLFKEELILWREDRFRDGAVPLR